jgi:hypothetical protein
MTYSIDTDILIFFAILDLKTAVDIDFYIIKAANRFIRPTRI